MTTTPNGRPHVSLLWATVERAAAIAEIHRGLFTEPWDAPAVARLLERPGATSMIAVVGDKRIPAGFVLGQIAADEAEVISVGVAPEWQRKGVGRQLVDGLMRAAKRAEAKRVYLEVGADNEAALALYRRLGFAEAGRRKGYYARQHPEPAVDAVVMAATL